MFRETQRDDFERIRLDRASWVRPQDDLSGGGVPAFVGQVTSKTSAIAVGDFFFVQPNFVLGPEVEGATGAFTPYGPTTIPVYLVGPHVPSTGDYLVCKFVDNRWVAERMGSSGGPGNGGIGTIPSCYCTAIPGTLTMTSLDETCNFRMFQSCAIQWQDTPSWAAPFGFPPMIFLSTQGFPDPLTPDNDLFYYYLTCQNNEFYLTRLYPTSPYGSPYRDILLYSWFTGDVNTCDPFRLDHGGAFSGSEASCVVTIDAAS